MTAWRWGDYLLSPARRRLLHRREPVELEDRAFDLLVLLLQNRERAVDRQEIISAIWGKRPVSDATLRQLVYKARRAVGDDGAHQTVIHTLYGRSLQWIAAVELEFDTEPQPMELVPAAPDNAIPEPAPADVLGAPVIPEVPAVAAPERNASRLRRRKSDAISRRMLVGGLIVVAVVALVAVGARVGTMGRRPAVRETSRTPRVAMAASTSEVTIAVLPFLGMNAQPGKRYLADGITEELINRLGRFPKLRVAARTSSFAFRDEPVDVRKAAQALGVENVLEGSVQRSGDRMRVQVALVSAKNGYEVWSDEYEPKAGDVLGVEDGIVEAVLKELLPKLDPRTLAALRDAHAHAWIDPAAHDFYLVGLQYLDRRTGSDIQQAIQYFRRAIQVDPDYADAWTGVASGYAVLRDYDADAPPDSHYEDALSAAQKAAMLDPQSPQVHSVLGLLFMRHWQWSQAAAEFRRALQLDPNDATAHQWYAIYDWFTGDMQSALAQMRTARELDPLSPIINADLARAMLYAGDADGAVTQAKAAVALAPHFELAHLFLAEALQAKDRYADAIREIRTGMALMPSPPAADDLAFLGQMEWAEGDHADARKLLDELETRAKQHYVSGVALASIEWPVGEKDRAFVNLDRAASDHDGLLMTVSGIRDYEWYRDPRFPKLLASMNLPVR